MRAALPTRSAQIAAQRLAQRLAEGVPQLPCKSLRGGGAACRLKGNRMDLSPVLGPEVVALIPEGVPAPPVFRRCGEWTFVPFADTERQVAVIVLQEDSHCEYVPVQQHDAEKKALGLRWTLGFVGKFASAKDKEEGRGYHAETLKRIDVKKKEDPNFDISRLGPLAPGTTLWMPPGTAFRITGGTNVLCFWWLPDEEEAMRTLWEHLLSPEVHGIVVGLKWTAVKPLEVYGFGNLAAPPADDSDPLPNRNALFPLASPDALPWKKTPTPPSPLPVAATQPAAVELSEPTVTTAKRPRPTEDAPSCSSLSADEFLRLLANVTNDLKSPAGQARSGEQITRELEAHIKPLRTALNAAIKADTARQQRWDTTGETRALIAKWHDCASVTAPDVAPAAAAAAAETIQFKGYGKEAKCKCACKEVIYANGWSRECFENDLLDRVQAIEAHNRKASKPLFTMLKAASALDAPEPTAGGGRSIPVKFRNQLQQLVDAVVAAEALLGIVPDDACESDDADDADDAETVRPKRKREAKDEEAEDEEEDEEEVSYKGDEEEEGEDDDDDDDMDVVDDEDEEEGEDEPKTPDGKKKRQRTAEAILDLKRDFPLEDDVAELETMFYKSSEQFYDAAMTKIALIRELPSIYKVRRDNHQWPWAYKTIDAAERKCQELNAHVINGHSTYAVYEEKMQKEQEAE